MSIPKHELGGLTKIIISDIINKSVTYGPELIPPLLFKSEAGGINSPNNLRSFYSVSCGLIKCIANSMV